MFAKGTASLRNHPRSLILALVGVLVVALVLGTAAAVASSHIEDINPDTSTNSNANAATGGRVNGLGPDPNDNSVFYAASEFGGIFKSTDGGSNWSHLDGHLPQVTWDVAVDPSDSSRVYATSFYDGRVDPVSGIQVSNDSGSSWTHPSTAQPNAPSEEGTGDDNTPQAGYTCSSARRTEPSAFGIAVAPNAPENVFIGTNCGLAISDDSGSTWTFVDPNSIPGFARNVWDVAVQGPDGSGNITVDVCGATGHWRSTDGGSTWGNPDATIPGGRCSIAVSPDESYVLFIVASDNFVYESDDGGSTWTNLGRQFQQGRIPFVVTNQRSDADVDSDSDTEDRFDLWYSDTRLFRIDCVTPDSPSSGGSPRCPAQSSGTWTNYQSGAHWDAGDLAFDTSVSVDACPLVYTTDGGAHTNTRTGGNCHAPQWTRSNRGLHALWLFGMAGADQSGDTNEDLYMGAQDTGSFGVTNGGASAATVSSSWTNRDCCDVFDMAAGSNNVLYSHGAARAGRTWRLKLRNPGLSGGGNLSDRGHLFTGPGDSNHDYPPDGLMPTFNFAEAIANYGGDKYVVLTRDCNVPASATDGMDNDGDGNTDEYDEGNGCTGFLGGDGGVFITNDITASPVSWTELGNASEPNSSRICDVQVAVSGGTPTFYVQAGGCNRRTSGSLWKFTGTSASGSWQRIDDNIPDGGGVGVWAVDPNDPDRLYASTLPASGPRMVFSDDGGMMWEDDPELDNLMTGNGAFQYQNQRGPTNFTRFSGYPQPTLLAYDPEDADILVAGGADSGVFVSATGGQNWALVTDPFGGGGVHLPRPYFAYFDHEPADEINLYIGTQGRGMWRLTLQTPVADADGPYTTDEGSNVTLDGTGSTDPNDDDLTFEWDLDNDGSFDDATGDSPTFEMVGQDGEFTIRLRVTDEMGLSDIDETTVTVNNVAPTVSLSSDAPKDEGSVVTVSGTVVDPGWEDPLSATIDWGDGSPVENVTGSLENERPDATLTFDATHVYGDNGTYTVEVCGSDDDTTTCESISVEIENVAPTVTIDPGQVTNIDEFDTVDVLAEFSDPGWLDTYTFEIDWGWSGFTPDTGGPLDVTPDNPPNPDIGTVSGMRQYGDNGVFTITVTVMDDDGGVGSASFDLTVDNVDPTAEIDETGTILINGMPTFLAHAGEPIDFTGRSTDPGSDDLTLSWDWDDEAPSPDVTTEYLLNPPNPDPDPSPTVDPRDVTDMKTHAFEDACFYEIVFAAADDDGGSAEDTANVIIVGNADQIRSAGYWRHQYRGNGKIDFTEEELNCYLDIVGYMSTVFNEEVDASTVESALDVLDVEGNQGSMEEIFDRQLLAAWLNFANGAVEWDEMVDTDGDGTADTVFSDVMAQAEAVRLDPNHTREELEAQKDILERINTSGG